MLFSGGSRRLAAASRLSSRRFGPAAFRTTHSRRHHPAVRTSQKEPDVGPGPATPRPADNGPALSGLRQSFGFLPGRVQNRLRHSHSPFQAGFHSSLELGQKRIDSGLTPPCRASRDLFSCPPVFQSLEGGFDGFSKGWKRVSGKVPRIGSGFGAGQSGSASKKCRREVDLGAQGVVE